MGIWTCRIDDDSDGAGHALLLDSCTMRPLALPLFADDEEAESFLDFAEANDMGDVRALGHDTLDRLHTAWLADREADALFAATSQEE